MANRMTSAIAIAICRCHVLIMAHSTPLHYRSPWLRFHVVQIRFRENLTYAPRLGFGISQ